LWSATRRQARRVQRTASRRCGKPSVVRASYTKPKSMRPSLPPLLMVTETNAPGAYCTTTRDGRWSVNGTVTSGTRREWLRMMAAMSGAALVNGLLPRELARAATGRVAQQQDPLAAFRARIGAVPIQAQPLAENLTLLAGPGGNVVVLRGSDGLVVVDTFVTPAWPRFQES